MNSLDIYERAIIHFLGFRGESSIHEIAKGLSMSWSTIEKRIRALYEKGYLIKKKESRKGIAWSLRLIEGDND